MISIWGNTVHQYNYINSICWWYCETSWSSNAAQLDTLVYEWLVVVSATLTYYQHNFARNGLYVCVTSEQCSWIKRVTFTVLATYKWCWFIFLGNSVFIIIIMVSALQKPSQYSTWYSEILVVVIVVVGVVLDALFLWSYYPALCMGSDCVVCQ